MGSTRQKLKNEGVVPGAWNMIPHPNVAEMMAGEDFDWICVDMEHTSQDFQTLENVILTLHRASNTVEANARMAQICIANCVDLANGRTADLVLFNQ